MHSDSDSQILAALAALSDKLSALEGAVAAVSAWGVGMKVSIDSASESVASVYSQQAAVLVEVHHERSRLPIIAFLINRMRT